MISHKYKTIFIHIPKTAGTSIKSIIPPNKKDRSPHSRPSNYGHYWNTYFTFTFVRNPWDRFLSTYFYCRKMGTGKKFSRKIAKEKPDFNTFILDWFQPFHINHIHRFRPQISWFIHPKTEQHFTYDFVGHMENLESDMKFVLNKIGVPYSHIPKLNTTKHKNYKQYYNDKSIEKIYNLYNQDIEYFGYTFEGLKK